MCFCNCESVGHLQDCHPFFTNRIAHQFFWFAGTTPDASVGNNVSLHLRVSRPFAGLPRRPRQQQVLQRGVLLDHLLARSAHEEFSVKCFWHFGSPNTSIKRFLEALFGHSEPGDHKHSLEHSLGHFRFRAPWHSCKWPARWKLHNMKDHVGREPEHGRWGVSGRNCCLVLSN